LINVYNEDLTHIRSFQAHKDAINRIKQSPFNNGSLVATVSNDETVKIWNLTSNWTLIRTYTGHNAQVRGLEFIDMATIASGSFDDTIQIWNIIKGSTTRTIDTGSNVVALQLLSNNFHLAAGLKDDRIDIYNINNGSLVVTLTLREQMRNLNDLALIDTDLLASSSDDNTIRIWNLTTNTCKFSLRGHSKNVNGLKFIYYGDVLASGSQDNTIILWNLTNGALLRTLTGHTDDIKCSVDMLNTDILVSGSLDKTIIKWNLTTGQKLNTISTGIQIQSLAVLNHS